MRGLRSIWSTHLEQLTLRRLPESLLSLCIISCISYVQEFEYNLVWRSLKDHPVTGNSCYILHQDGAFKTGEWLQSRGLVRGLVSFLSTALHEILQLSRPKQKHCQLSSIASVPPSCSGIYSSAKTSFAVTCKAHPATRKHNKHKLFWFELQAVNVFWMSET